MRVIHTEPLRRLVARKTAESRDCYYKAHAHVYLVKSGGDAETTHALSGELYASKSGWILLSVPNALVRGAFDALNEPGVELPLQSSGLLNAHISVMRPEEIEQIGGIDKITERGHHFHYTLGPVQEVVPASWGEMSKVWFIQVRSKELQDLRKAYGLPPKPNNNQFDFHITIAVRRKKILQHNDVAKSAAEKRALSPIVTIGIFNAMKRIANPQEQADAIERFENDTSYLNDIRRLPTTVATPQDALPTATAAEPKKRQRRNSSAAALATILDNNRIHNQRANSSSGGKNFKLLAPTLLGLTGAGLGGAALYNHLTKEGEDEHGLLETSSAPEDKDNAPGRIGYDGRGSEAETEEELSSGNEEEDFECTPASLKAICDYYGAEKEERNLSELTNVLKTIANDDSIYDKSANFFSTLKRPFVSMYERGKEQIKNVYGKLEQRYGPTMAKTIVGAGIVGAPIPGPGTSVIVAAPFLAAGELMHAFRGDYEPKTEEIEETKKKKRKIKQAELLDVLKKWAGGPHSHESLHSPGHSGVSA